MSIPSVSVSQMREVDRLAVEEFGLSINMMMENASGNIAKLARKMLGGSAKSKNIVILSHKGNNGGDGLGAARHLINYGANISCYITSPFELLTLEGKSQYKVLEATNTPIEHISQTPSNQLISDLNNADLVIDALLGYNLDGNPREPIASVVQLANKAQKPILSVDIPSGLHGDTGESFTPTIKANSTLTLALPKNGLLTPQAKQYVGELYVADLSIPKQIYDRIGIQVQVIFEKEEVVKVSL